MKFQRYKGFALAYCIPLCVLIVLVTAPLVLLSRDSLRATRGGLDTSRALFAAESGMTQLIAELERDPNFNGEAQRRALPGGTASYSYTFSTSGTTSCVNNLQSENSAASHRGPASVPAHAALLIVTGRSGTAERTLETLVVAGFDALEGDALTASGRLTMEGSVRIDGRESLTDPNVLEADLHSNSEESGVQVSYRSSGSADTFSTSGRLTSSSSETEANAFQVSSAVASSLLQSNVPQKLLPRPNIEAMVSDGASQPGPPIPSAPGNVVMTGVNHYGTDVVINGDLILEENTTLLVSGDLSVNGSIRGRGQVVVTGNTEFYGDAQVAHGLHDYISLLSKGHVVLKGFQGERYLRALVDSGVVFHRDLSGVNPTFLATNPPTDSTSPLFPETASADLTLRNLNAGLGAIQESIRQSGFPDDGRRLQAWLTQQNVEVDIVSSLVGPISVGPTLAAANPNVLASIGVPTPTFDNAGLVRSYLAGRPGGRLSAARFLEERFTHLDDVFRDGLYARDLTLLPEHDPDGISRAWRVFLDYENWDARAEGGIFQAMQSQPTADYPGPTLFGFPKAPSLTPEQEELVLDVVQSALQFEVDRLGSAHFKGIVYTSGAFVATDDVIVRGSIIVNGDPNLEDLVVDEGTFRPGDVGLFGYSTLTYVEEFFDDGVHNLAGGGSLDVKQWLSR